MRVLAAAALITTVLGACAAEDEPVAPAGLVAGVWSAWLDSPGGELRFGLELDRDEGEGWRAALVNGAERIVIPRVAVEGDEIVLGLDHYAAEIRARVSAGGSRLDGRWVKRRTAGTTAELPFHAESRRRATTSASPDAFGGTWRVTFSSDPDNVAVGLFEPVADELRGTFQTLTGDYRYLAGRRLESGAMELACFDGAHAFLFRAELRDDGRLAGDFWSADTWHETWTAVRDDDARLADGFAQTRWLDGVTVNDLEFPDLDGVARKLGDEAFAGKARILQIFGSWCPNCHDAAEFLARLSHEFAESGLSIVGLAFEMSGDAAKDAEQVRRYAERHGADWPILLAGTARKDDATRQLGALDRVRSFPTTVFLHADGRVRAVYSGFSGPATGAAHERLTARFRAIVKELLAE